MSESARELIVEADSTEKQSDREAVERLNAVEISNDLFSLRSGEWCVWPLFKMGTMIRLTGLDVASSTKPPSYLWRLKAALNDAKALALAEPADAVIKTGTSTLLDVVGHKYRELIFDEIITSLRSVHKIETVTADDHLVRRANALVPALATSAIVDFVAAAGSRLPPSAEEKALGAQLSRILRQELGSVAYSPEAIARHISHFNWGRRAYKRVLSRSCRQLLIVGDPGEHAAVAAARELGLATVEFQHGLLNAFHPGYAWPNVKPEDSTHIPIADRLFLFGDYWRETLETMRFWNDRLDVVGSLRLD